MFTLEYYAGVAAVRFNELIIARVCRDFISSESIRSIRITYSYVNLIIERCEAYISIDGNKINYDMRDLEIKWRFNLGDSCREITIHDDHELYAECMKLRCLYEFLSQSYDKATRCIYSLNGYGTQMHTYITITTNGCSLVMMVDSELYEYLEEHPLCSELLIRKFLVRMITPVNMKSANKS